MNHHNRRLAAGSVMSTALLLLITACGGDQTMASKSAAAFRDAQKKGTPIGGDAHGGHSAGGADQGAMTMPGMDHSKMNMAGQPGMAGMDHSRMPGMQPGQSMAGMDHSKMQGQSAMPGMDHSKMNMAGQPGMAGLDHSRMPGMQPGQSMAGMDHSKMNMGAQSGMAGMDHSKMAGMQGMNMTDPETEAIVSARSATPAPGMSAASLVPDPLDAPAPTAIVDAQKSAEMANMMASGAHGMAHGEYVPSDVGREDSNTPQQMQHPMPGDARSSTDRPGVIRPPAPAGHSDHQMPPAAKERKTLSPAPASTTGHGTHGTSPPSATPRSQEVQVIYTCPMHPEVRSAVPGKCPKCGMTLVKKEKK